MNVISFLERTWGRMLGERKTSDEKYAWYVRRLVSNRYMKALLMPHYKEVGKADKKEEKIVFCLYNGMVRQGGLADRLRGIISTYYICKQQGVRFRIVFTHPFNLRDYLEPNIYDWYADSSSVSFDIPEKNILMLDTILGSDYEKRHQQKWLYSHIKEAKGQVHVYTNAPFSYNHGYHELFNELFKPSLRLKEAIEKELDVLKEGYISVSCRFLDLLGDFNETCGYKEQLTESERESLLDMLTKCIEMLHTNHPNKKVLCNSDSKIFLTKVSTLDYTYVIPGEITHIDAHDSNGDYHFYEKTFLDFFMIAHADYIYMLKMGKMHNSGYPYAASLVYDKPYSVICS